MEHLARITASRKTGAEPLTADGKPIGLTIADVWAWGWSDLLGNTERGVLAEFIVAAALGIATDRVREGWAVWDLTMPDGVRIEVKSSGYLQSWGQKELSRISFDVRETLAWDADTGEFADTARRHADVYVFALLGHKDKSTVNPLDLDQWIFYVLATQVLNERSRGSITLKGLEAVTKPVTFSGLGEAVKAAHSAALP